MVSDFCSIIWIMSCYLSMIHPALFTQQIQWQQRLLSRQCDNWLNNPHFTHDLFPHWTPVFLGYIISRNQVISKCWESTDPYTYHCLMSLGSHSSSFVNFPILDAGFPFEPRTLIFFAAAALDYRIDAALAGKQVAIQASCDLRLGQQALGHKYMAHVNSLPSRKCLQDHLTLCCRPPQVQTCNLTQPEPADIWIDNSEYIWFWITYASIFLVLLCGYQFVCFTASLFLCNHPDFDASHGTARFCLTYSVSLPFCLDCLPNL